MNYNSKPSAADASSNAVLEALEESLRLSLGTFPGESLHYLKSHLGDLIRGKYQEGEKGCIFNLLSRPLEFRIDSRPALSLWFTGDAGCSLREYSPLYLASRTIIEAWDNGTLQSETIEAAVDRILESSDGAGEAERSPARLQLWEEFGTSGIPVVPCFVRSAAGEKIPKAPRMTLAAELEFAAPAKAAPVQLEMVFEESDCPF